MNKSERAAQKKVVKDAQEAAKQGRMSQGAYLMLVRPADGKKGVRCYALIHNWQSNVSVNIERVPRPDHKLYLQKVRRIGVIRIIRFRDAGPIEREAIRNMLDDKKGLSRLRSNFNNARTRESFWKTLLPFTCMPEC